MPAPYESWETMLESITPEIRCIVSKLSDAMLTRLGNVTAKSIGRYYVFYKGKESSGSAFAAFILSRRALKVRIRTESKFEDSEYSIKTRKYRGWFFSSMHNQQEREFSINKSFKRGIDPALKLIETSYKLAGYINPEQEENPRKHTPSRRASY